MPLDLSKNPSTRFVKKVNVFNAIRAKNIVPTLSLAAFSFALGFSDPSSADGKLWLNGSAYSVDKYIKNNLPSPSVSDDWISFGDISDRAGNTITSKEQFENLLEGKNGEILFINQKTGKLILKWNNFDINEGYSVEFKQPDATSIALNKIDNSTYPTHILGNLKSNGGVYILNANGIIFGDNARVNVGSLLASTLDVDEEFFKTSVLAAAIREGKGNAAFFNEEAATGTIAKFDEHGNLVLLSTDDIASDNTAMGDAPARGDIAVLEGAKIESKTLNGVVAVAPNVLNAGSIKSPDGQTILAAVKDEAYVVFSDDPSLRGLLIEVNKGGNVSNLGSIIAERGNVTLAGLAINQGGRVSATTSVDFNGSVRLLARDTLTRPDRVLSTQQISSFLDFDSKTIEGRTNTANFRVSSQGGSVVLADGSVTEVSAQVGDGVNAPDAQAQRTSAIEISGAIIEIDDATVEAHGGDIYIDAFSNLNKAFSNADYEFRLGEGDSPSRVTLSEGASIDVSGLESQVAMSTNVVEVELRGNELADSPLQRDGFLEGKKIKVDVRTGTPLANIEPVVNGIPRQIGERLRDAGNIYLRSDGEVIVQPGASLNISGGVSHYDSGYIVTSNLVSEGRVINVADADPNLVYSGVIGDESTTNQRFNITRQFSNAFLGSNRGVFYEGYDQGGAAGDLDIKAQVLYFQGDIEAAAVTGPYQRSPSSSAYVTGGGLNIALNLQSLVLTPELVAPFDLSQALLAPNPDWTVTSGDNPNLLYAVRPFELSDTTLNDSGLSHLKLSALNGSVLIEESSDLVLTSGASVAVSASDSISVLGQIHSPGADVSLITTDNRGGFVPAEVTEAINRPIVFGDQALINTSGNWVNDNPLLKSYSAFPVSPIQMNGGNVSVVAVGDLDFGFGSAITADGGAWFDASGKLHAGRGGDITLSAKLKNEQPTSNLNRSAALTLEGSLSSTALFNGGALSITAPAIFVGDEVANSQQLAPSFLKLDSGIFSRGGFSRFNLRAEASSEYRSEFVFGDSVAITPVMRNFVVDLKSGLDYSSSLSLLESRDNLSGALSKGQLPDYLRQKVDLSFVLNDRSDSYLYVDTGPESVYAGKTRSNLDIHSGVSIEAGYGAEIEIASNTSIVFSGLIKAPGGDVSLSYANQKASIPFDIDNIDDVGVWVSGDIDVSSAFRRSPPTPEGLVNVGEVIDAGSVTLSTNRGFVILDSDSTVDVSASSYPYQRIEPKDKFGSQIVTHQVAAEAGRISIHAAEGAILDGNLLAQSATAQGAMGGRFELSLDASKGSRAAYSFNSTIPTSEDPFQGFDFSTISYAKRQINVHDEQPPVLGAEVKKSDFGQVDAVPDRFNGIAELSTATLMDAGFDDYVFHAAYTDAPSSVDQSTGHAIPAYSDQPSKGGIGVIVFKGDSVLSADKSIALDVTTLRAESGRAIVAAPYISMGFSSQSKSDDYPSKLADDISGGEGELLLLATNTYTRSGATKAEIEATLLTTSSEQLLADINAPVVDGLLDIVGHVATQGTSHVTLASSGDVRARGVLLGNGTGDDARMLGSLSVFDDLTLQADQVYPTTLSEFAFSSGQYNLSTESSNADNAPGIKGLQLSIEYIHPQTGQTIDATYAASIYELYDVYTGVLAPGGSVERNIKVDVERDGKTIQESLAVPMTVKGINDSARIDGAGGAIQIVAGGPAKPVLSALGSLIFDAQSINQGGVVKAPMGKLTFNGRANAADPQGDNVFFQNGSLTSISLEEQTVLFGSMDAAGELNYYPDASDPTVGLRLYESLPDAEIVLNGPNLNLQAGAQVDLSGGGDLLAYQFIPGPGGSKDVLASGENQKSFAILPSLNPSYSPFDPYTQVEATGSFNYQVGDSVYLSNSATLKGGVYSILPARYALLPGALLITPLSENKTYIANQQLHRVDGAPIVAGYFTQANTEMPEALMSGFVVEAGSVALDRSEIRLTSANEHFATESLSGRLSSIPNDAGALTLQAESKLSFESLVDSVGSDSGRDASLMIVSEILSVSDAVNEAEIKAGSVVLDADQIFKNGFGSIVLGGLSRRATSDAAMSVTAYANEIYIDQNTAIETSELILAVRESESGNPGLIHIDSGATISLSSDGEKNAATPSERVKFSGDGFLGLSSSHDLNVSQISGGLGDVNFAEGAALNADNGSTTFMSSSQLHLDGDLNLSGGSLAISAGKMALFGNAISDESPVPSGTLVLLNEHIASMNVDRLSLESLSTLDLYGNVDVDIASLNVRAQSIIGHGLVDDVARLSVRDVLSLYGSDQASLDESTSTSKNIGSLALAANQIVLADGNLTFKGFDNILIEAQSVLSGDKNGQFVFDGNKKLSVHTPLITATSAANTVIETTGLFEVLQTQHNSDVRHVPAGLGARLSVVANAVEIDGHIQLNSGHVEISARGDEVSPGIVFGESGLVDVSGMNVVVGESEYASPGGSISLSALHGDLSLNAGSVLDVSGIDGSRAGSITLNSPNGLLTNAGEFRAQADEKSNGGSLSVISHHLSSFSDFYQGVKDFSKSLSLRVIEGDLTLEATDQVVAGDLTLTADSGSVLLLGGIDAGQGGLGRVSINAGEDIRLGAGGTLAAKSTNAGDQVADDKFGGAVELSTSNGAIILDTSARIDVSGGSVNMRAPRLQDGIATTSGEAGNDLAIELIGNGTLSDVVVGAGKVTLEAVKVYEVESAVSEIFSTTPDGSSTLSVAPLFVADRERFPLGAFEVCESAGGCMTAEGLSVALGERISLAGSSCDSPFSVCGYSFDISDTRSSIAYIESHDFMKHAEAIEARLFGDAPQNINATLVPGIEVQATGNLIVDQTLDFAEDLWIPTKDLGFFSAEVSSDTEASAWRFNETLTSVTSTNSYDFTPQDFDWYTNGVAGVLTLKAGADLLVNSPVTDGFTDVFSAGLYVATGFNRGARKELLSVDSGWRYRLVAGADLGSADVLALGDSGSIKIADQVFVRSSTGDIDLAAADSLILGKDATIYTAGRDTGKGFYDEVALKNTERAPGSYDQFDPLYISNAVYPTDGGSIRINVGSDLIGSSSKQFFNNWLQRIGQDVLPNETSGLMVSPSDYVGGLPLTWAVVPDEFRQDIAVLGGGNISIRAGRDVSDVSVSIPTTGKNVQAFTIGESVNKEGAADLQILGGGSLDVYAGGDINSAKFLLGKGSAEIRAEGALGTVSGGSETILASMDGHYRIESSGDVNLGKVINPTVEKQSLDQAGLNKKFGYTDLLPGDFDTMFFTYSEDASVDVTSLTGDVNISNRYDISGATVADTIAVSESIYSPILNISALQGDINILDSASQGFHLFPSAKGALNLLAGGSIRSQSVGSFISVSDSDAAKLPRLNAPFWESNDETAGILRNSFGLIKLFLDDIERSNGVTEILQPDGLLDLLHAKKAVHLNDPNAVRLEAGTGDIENIRLISPTKANVKAGRDIKNIVLEVQNLNDADTSYVSASRDIVFTTPRDLLNFLQLDSVAQGIDVAGPGNIEIVAGRDIALGASRGVRSVGSTYNPNLPLALGLGDEDGANITVMAGINTSPTYRDFSEKYFSNYESPNGFVKTTDLIRGFEQQNIADREETKRTVNLIGEETQKDYLGGRDIEKLSPDQIATIFSTAIADFKNLDWTVQQAIAFGWSKELSNNYAGALIAYVASDDFSGKRINSDTLKSLTIEEQFNLAYEAFNLAPEQTIRKFVLDSYFNEVKQGGIQDALGAVENPEVDGFARSYSAISSLFPTTKLVKDNEQSTDQSGSLSLVFSTLQTQQGGDINLVVPNGNIDVGVASIGSGASKKSSDLGLIVLRSGNINTSTSNNTNVNSSRVFALDGGDILLWSSHGDIDAGRGAKTALTVPPPVVREDGSVNFQAAVAGSGIRNSRFTQGRSPGAVYLFAPSGVVDAGDAGIGSEGDVLVAAQEVIGADNIDVGGTSIGIPEASGISASLSTASGSGSNETGSSAADSLDKKLDDSESGNVAFVTVEVLGFDFDRAQFSDDDDRDEKNKNKRSNK